MPSRISLTLSSLLALSLLSGCIIEVEGDCVSGDLFDLDGLFFGCEEEDSSDPFEDDWDGFGCIGAMTDGYCDGDQDTIPDEVEGMIDTDGDGDPDCEDPDSDGDGLADIDECGSDPHNPVDSDGDGVPDFRDSDSDDDGLEDGTEGLDDTDGDGASDHTDTDSDDDGFSDTEEAGDDLDNPADTDEDGTPDFQDEDSDNDGIEDADESLGDIDEDGIPDVLDAIDDRPSEDELEELEDDAGKDQDEGLASGTSAPECGGCQGTMSASATISMALLCGLPLGFSRRRRSWE